MTREKSRLLRKALALDSSKNDQTTLASRPASPTEGSQVHDQAQDHLFAQFPSPGTVQGNGIPQPMDPEGISYPNFGVQQMQPMIPHHQQQYSPYHTGMPASNYTYGQASQNIPVPTYSQMFDPTMPPMPLHQNPHEASVYHYPDSRGPYPINGPAAVPSAEVDALAGSHSCSCGPGCNCVYCAKHLDNNATLQQVQELNYMMQAGNVWDGNLPVNPNVRSQPSGSGGIPTNGTAMGPELGQGQPLLNNGFFPHDMSGGLVEAPTQGPALQPFNGYSARTMRNSEYVTVGYRVGCPNPTANCHCGIGCPCARCASHLGH